MDNLNAWGLDSATDDFRVHEAERLVDAVLVRARQPLIDAVTFFIEKPICPLTLMAAVITLLRTDCGVTMGVKRLRQCIEQLSKSMEEFRQEHQVNVLLESLQKASSSSGSRKPVLAVGRDGITLREYAHSAFQVATTATVSVYDRQGKRLITVYLAHPPELGQATMDLMLTELLTELLERYDGPLPRLAYVTDFRRERSSCVTVTSSPFIFRWEVA